MNTNISADKKQVRIVTPMSSSAPTKKTDWFAHSKFIGDLKDSDRYANNWLADSDDEDDLFEIEEGNSFAYDKDFGISVINRDMGFTQDIKAT